MSNYLILVNNLDIYKYAKEVGYTTFLFALKDYSIGYSSFDLDTINNLDSNNYLLINRILESNDILNLKTILKNDLNIKGIIFEDIGVYELVKELNKDYEMIYFHNHAGTNYETINYWLELGVDSVVISNEITKEEINEIINKTNKPLVLTLLGHNQVMYSRRQLLTNYNLYNNINCANELDLKTGNSEFILVESNYGTVFYTKDIYNYFSVKSDLLKYQLINMVLIDNENVKKILDDIKKEEYEFSYLNPSLGFLNTKTIFKLGGKNNE